MALIDETRTVLGHAARLYAPTPVSDRLAALVERLDAPVTVAVAGRVKSGKSTLLNALVGERLAPTGTGECTRIVTWYRDGHTCRVDAYPRGAPPRPVGFARRGGALSIDIGPDPPDALDRLVVTWPSQALRLTTLIDTPGIGSLTESASRRTWDLLTVDDTDAAPADAVLYLMKHLHPGDVEFLRAFQDVEVSRPSPVNALGILSRADEIAAGRPDAMASARRIATRLSRDPAVRRVVQAVLPVAGLLAETAATLTEAEVGHLRQVAALEPAEAEELLLTADRFVSRCPDLNLTPADRLALLDRFGLFGVRVCVARLRRGPAPTAGELAGELTELSGLGELRSVLASLFLGRSDVLKCRSALIAVNAIVRAVPVPGGERLAAEVEQRLASTHAFTELRLLAAVRAGTIAGKPDVVAELERLVGGSGTAARLRLGLPGDSGEGEIRRTAHEVLSRWRRRAENPLTPYELSLASRVAVRSCEGILAALPSGR
jgi:hypothetical protein